VQNQNKAKEILDEVIGRSLSALCKSYDELIRGKTDRQHCERTAAAAKWLYHWLYRV